MSASSKAKRVREVVAKYHVTRKPRKCRVLSPKELGELAKQMQEAYDRGDKAESNRLKEALISGFYGEICA